MEVRGLMDQEAAVDAEEEEQEKEVVEVRDCKDLVEGLDVRKIRQVVVEVAWVLQARHLMEEMASSIP